MKSMLVLVLAVTMPAVAQQNPETALRAAMHQETVKGDLKGAVEQYRKLTRSNNRAVAAMALVRMGQCYEKLGDTEARNAYERVVREFSDQNEPSQIAHQRLAGLGTATSTGQARQELLWRDMTGSEPALSPDGTFMVYIRDFNLRYRNFATGEDRAITTDGSRQRWASSPQVSPDSKSVAYVSRLKDELCVIRLDGSGRRVLTTGNFFAPGAWSPDGRRILAVRQQDFSNLEKELVSVEDGKLTVLSSGIAIGATQNAFSPDGRFIVYHKLNQSPRSGNSIWIMRADGSEAISLVEDPNHPTGAMDAMWTPDGTGILFVSHRSGDAALWSLRMADGRAQGQPELAVKIDAAPLRIMPDGTLFYLNQFSQHDVYVADLDAAAWKITSAPRRVNPQYVGETNSPSLDWSSDGRSIVYTRFPLGANGSFVVHSLESGQERTIRPNTAAAFPQQIRYFPDGRSVLTFDYSAQQTFFRRIDTQTGAASNVFHLPGRKPHIHWQSALSPDGRTLFYSAMTYEGENPLRVIRRDIESGQEKVLVQMRTRGTGAFSLSASPDGRHVAFIHIDAQGQRCLMTVPTEGGVARQLSQSAATTYGTAWSKDSKRVLFVKTDSAGRGPHIATIPFEGGNPESLGISMQTTHFALDPENKRIAFVGGQYRRDLWVYRNLLSVAAKR
jgi:Tol biopolymer transport system component